MDEQHYQNLMSAIETRHAVRSYTDKPLPASLVEQLQREVDACNEESGLHMQLVVEDTDAFVNGMAHFGKFTGVRNYLALVGKKSEKLQEAVGYYGERVTLLAQVLGLNSCWVAMTFSKGSAKQHCTIDPGEKLVCVVSLGYGETQGVPHKVKPLEELYQAEGNVPDWFLNGMKAAQLAPTAVNQQKFRFTLDGDTVRAEALGGSYDEVDLGIVECHFEIGARRKCFDLAAHRG